MENLIFSLNATVPVFLMMILGIVFRQIGWIDEVFAAKMNQFVFRVSLPAVLFIDLAGVDFVEAWNPKFVLFCFAVTFLCILVSALLAIIFKPLVGRLARLRIRGWHLPRWAAALATLILIWVLFVVACTLFVPLVFDKLYQFATLDFGSVLRSVEEPIARMQEYLHDLFALPDERFSLTDSLIQWFKSIFDYDTINTAFSSIVSLTLSAVIAFFSVSFITFFFLKDDELFLSMLKAPFPERVHGNIERAMSSVSQLLMRYFTGILSESCILMIVISVTMIFFGMRTQDAFFIGLIMGVMNVVPYAGPLIGGVMSVFMGVVTPIEGMTTGHTMFVIAGSLLIIKGFDDFVLQPTLYSERVKAHPLEIFIVILIAGSLAGIVGMLLAIPSYTVLRVFAKEFFSQFSLVRKLTEKI